MADRFVFDLDEERRALLEAYRARMGLRSLTAALHHLIDASVMTSNELKLRDAGAAAVRDRLVVGEDQPELGSKIVTIEYPVAAPPKLRKPAAEEPKSEPFKSRLKGEWKAP